MSYVTVTKYRWAAARALCAVLSTNPQEMEGLGRTWAADRYLWGSTVSLGFMEVHLKAQQIFQTQLTKGTISYIIKVMSVAATLSQLGLSFKARMSEPAQL